MNRGEVEKTETEREREEDEFGITFFPIIQSPRITPVSFLRQDGLAGSLGSAIDQQRIFLEVES
jgi:hypothetical protein